MHNFALSPVTQKVDKPMISSPIRTPTTFKVWRPSFDGQAWGHAWFVIFFNLLYSFFLMDNKKYQMNNEPICI